MDANFPTFQLAMADAGLSSVRLVKLLTQWGDDRTPDNLRRWVQRALKEEPGANPHLALVLKVVSDHRKQRDRLRRQIHLFESPRTGTSNLHNLRAAGDNVGDRMVASLLSQKEVLDDLLIEVRPPIHLFRSGQHPDRFCFCEAELCLPPPDEWFMIPSSTNYSFKPEQHGENGPAIVADIGRWGFSVVEGGKRVTEQF